MNSDAHRPLLDLEPLADIFRRQEDRKVRTSLALHYKRVMYVFEDSETAHRARGNQVRIFEAEDGTRDAERLQKARTHRERTLIRAAANG